MSDEKSKAGWYDRFCWHPVTAGVCFSICLAIAILSHFKWKFSLCAAFTGLVFVVALCKYFGWGRSLVSEPEEDKHGPAFWRDMFENRAKRTLMMPDREAAAQLGIDLKGDFGKVRNDQPTKEFALNLDVKLADLAVHTLPVTGRDDFGNAFTELPIAWAPHSVDLDLMSCCVPIAADGPSMSVREFLEQLAGMIRQVYDRPARPEFDPAKLPFESLRIRRLVWLAGEENWYVLFGQENYDRYGAGKSGLPEPAS
jgi:hypothetical protein